MQRLRCQFRGQTHPFWPLAQRRTAPASQALHARRRVLQTVAASDPYAVLGVGRAATLAEVKRAYRKKALKLHPDVNKAPDARERFMECKNAYQDIVDRQSRGSRGGASRSAPPGWGGGAGGSGPANGRRPPQPQEEFYGLDELLGSTAEGVRSGVEFAFGMLGDLFRDLEREWDSYSNARRQGSTEPKSLWEELADVGEEFVEFLEKGMGLDADARSNEKAEDIYDRYKRQYGDDDVTSSSSSTSRSGSQGTEASGKGAAAGTGAAQPGARSSSRSAGGAGAPPPKSFKEAVDEDLEDLKRRMGLK